MKITARIFLLGLTILIVTSMYYAIQNASLYVDASDRKLQELSQAMKNEERILSSVSSPPQTIQPVTSISKAHATHSVEGIFEHTNKLRKRYKLPPLNLSPELTAAARERARHMFAEGYFDHDSPSGESFSLSIEMTGYATILTGENIALGNFTNDQKLVDAWYKSPGHRKNLLFSHFGEIGIAAVEGIFQNKKTWISVQLFSAPPSSCRAPSEKQKIKIAKLRDTTQQKIVQLQTLKGILETSNNQETLLAFEQIYNDFNGENKQLNKLVSSYNTSVQEYNNCVQKIARAYEQSQPSK